MKRSVVIGPGIYQWEWLDDKIAVARWDVPPSSTDQWIIIGLGEAANGPREFYLEGTCNEDIRVCPAPAVPFDLRPVNKIDGKKFSKD